MRSIISPKGYAIYVMDDDDARGDHYTVNAQTKSGVVTVCDIYFRCSTAVTDDAAAAAVLGWADGITEDVLLTILIDRYARRDPAPTVAGILQRLGIGLRETARATQGVSTNMPESRNAPLQAPMHRLMPGGRSLACGADVEAAVGNYTVAYQDGSANAYPGAVLCEECWPIAAPEVTAEGVRVALLGLPVRAHDDYRRMRVASGLNEVYARRLGSDRYEVQTDRGRSDFTGNLDECVEAVLHEAAARWPGVNVPLVTRNL